MSDRMTQKNDSTGELPSGLVCPDDQGLAPPPPYDGLNNEASRSTGTSASSLSPVGKKESIRQRAGRMFKQFFSGPEDQKKPTAQSRNVPRRPALARPSPPRTYTSRYKYTVEIMHIPPDYQSKTAWIHTPWIASLCLYCAQLENQLPRHFPWRGYLDKPYKDKLYVDTHPLRSSEKLYVRCLSIRVPRNPGSPGAWCLCIRVWSQDAHWLADLDRASFGNFISLESAVKALACEYPGDNPLESQRLFYLKFPKQWRIGYTDPITKKAISTPEEAEKALRADHPGLRRLLDDHLERHIQHPNDKYTKFDAECKE